MSHVRKIRNVVQDNCVCREPVKSHSAAVTAIVPLVSPAKTIFAQPVKTTKIADLGKFAPVVCAKRATASKIATAKTDNFAKTTYAAPVPKTANVLLGNFVCRVVARWGIVVQTANAPEAASVQTTHVAPAPKTANAAADMYVSRVFARSRWCYIKERTAGRMRRTERTAPPIVNLPPGESPPPKVAPIGSNRTMVQNTKPFATWFPMAEDGRCWPVSKVISNCLNLHPSYIKNKTAAVAKIWSPLPISATPVNSDIWPSPHLIFLVVNSKWNVAIARQGLGFSISATICSRIGILATRAHTEAVVAGVFSR